MNRLKELRTERGLLQSDIAKIIGKSGRIIGFYESGERDMGTDTLAKLADYFDVSIDYLLGKTDIRNSGKQIDDVLNEAMIGMSAKEYDSLSENTKNAIKNFAIYMKEQEKGDKK